MLPNVSALAPGTAQPSSMHFERYLELVAPARDQLAQSQFVTRILAPEVSVDLLELFLIHFCSLGVSMTRPVEDWIRRAGERTLAMGWRQLGAALVMHASHEANHHEMMIQDTRSLVQRRHRRGLPLLSDEELLVRPPPPAVLRYIELHERVIASEAPYAQLAIEYEIERMSMVYGPLLTSRCKQILGDDIMECMSFVDSHARLDIGHTRFNEHQLESLLASQPSCLMPLAHAGAEALGAYCAFFDHCIERCEQSLAAAQ